MRNRLIVAAERGAMKSSFALDFMAQSGFVSAVGKREVLGSNGCYNVAQRKERR